jgi:hypothetical protein
MERKTWKMSDVRRNAIHANAFRSQFSSGGAGQANDPVLRGATVASLVKCADPTREERKQGGRGAYYAPFSGCPTRPDVDAKLTIAPPSFTCGICARRPESPRQFLSF